MIYYILALALTALLPSWTSPLCALKRDYNSDCGVEDGEESFEYYYRPYCVEDAPCRIPEIITPPTLAELIPATGPKCVWCCKPSIYLGYLDPDFQKYANNFKQQLEYSNQYSECSCLVT